ncbi:MAG: hypothetical protein R6X02_01380 [Enhygromyxa sp.]
MSRRARMIRLTALLAALLVFSGCGGSFTCTEIGCDSVAVVDYGDVVVNEPYALNINIGGQLTSVVCLSNDPDDEPLPEWLRCDAGGFEITGELADNTTVTVAVVPLSTNEVVIPNVLVPLTVEEVLRPNGPDCEPVCYRRTGTVPPSADRP